MKIRKLKALLYIFSSIMVLGLALLSFDTAKPVQTTVQPPTGTPSPTINNTDLTSKETPIPTITLTPTPTATPTPSPTPTPSLAELNALIPIQPATDDIGLTLTTAVTDYLNTYYSDETLQVKNISNINCHYKEGILDADYFVYAAYDVNYEKSNVLMPTLTELCISVDGDTITVQPAPTEGEISEALLLSRASESVVTLYLQETVRRYMNAELTYDEDFIFPMVTDSNYVNIDTIQLKKQFYMGYYNHQYIIRSCPEEITEFDYIVYVAHDLEVFNITTLSPGMDEYLIKLDENNYPAIFYGETSDAADEFRTSSREQEDVQTVWLDVFERLNEAISKDSDLYDFWTQLTEKTGNSSGTNN